MTLLLMVAALVVVAGGVVSVSARESRVAVLGTTVVLLGAPLLVDPGPGFLPLAARLVSATLASYLLWVSTRGWPGLGHGSSLGWPVESLAAAAGLIVGLGAIGLGPPAIGPVAAGGAGFALATLAVLPIAFGCSVPRVGNGLILLVTAAGLIRVHLGGTPPALEELVVSGMTVALAAIVAFLASHARELEGIPDRARAATSGDR